MNFPGVRPMPASVERIIGPSRLHRPPPAIPQDPPRSCPRQHIDCKARFQCPSRAMALQMNPPGKCPGIFRRQHIGSRCKACLVASPPQWHRIRWWSVVEKQAKLGCKYSVWSQGGEGDAISGHVCVRWWPRDRNSWLLEGMGCLWVPAPERNELCRYQGDVVEIQRVVRCHCEESWCKV